ncbi:thioredoxin domain-containing protein [Longimicrobium sp.]|uniref:thioredoxin domain-containing protein n=1 Tax=Longimicrobium sp. TaxID=2029185 RepID=UPI003B3BE994
MNRPILRLDPYFVAGVVAVLVSGLAYRAQLPRAQAEPLPLSSLVSGFTAGLDALGAGRSLGAPGAPVQVVELFDYQCPACAVAHDSVWPGLARRIGAGQVRYTAYDLPLPGHGNAIPAAVVAHCVLDDAPERFAQVRGHLFRAQAAWSEAYPAEPALLAVVAGMGVDSAAVRTCVDQTGPARAAVYRQTWTAARAAGVTFTPAWAVNGKVVPWNALEGAVAAALRTGGSTHGR